MSQESVKNDQNLRRIDAIYNLAPNTSRPLSSGVPLKRSHNDPNLAKLILGNDSGNKLSTFSYDENQNRLLKSANKQVEFNVEIDARAVITDQNYHNNRDERGSPNQDHHEHHHYEHHHEYHHEHHRRSNGMENGNPEIPMRDPNEGHKHRHSKDNESHLERHEHRHSKENETHPKGHEHRHSNENMNTEHRKHSHRPSNTIDDPNDYDKPETHHEHRHRHSKEKHASPRLLRPEDAGRDLDKEHHRKHSHRLSNQAVDDDHERRHSHRQSKYVDDDDRNKTHKSKYEDDLDRDKRRKSNYVDEDGREKRRKSKYTDDDDGEKRHQSKYSDEDDREKRRKSKYADENDHEKRHKSKYVDENDPEKRRRSKYADDDDREKRRKSKYADEDYYHDKSRKSKYTDEDEPKKRRRSKYTDEESREQGRRHRKSKHANESSYEKIHSPRNSKDKNDYPKDKKRSGLRPNEVIKLDFQPEERKGRKSHRHSKDKDEEIPKMTEKKAELTSRKSKDKSQRKSEEIIQESKGKSKNNSKSKKDKKHSRDKYVEGEENFVMGRYIADASDPANKDDPINVKNPKKSKNKKDKKTVEEFQTFQDFPLDIFKDKKKDAKKPPSPDLNFNTLPSGLGSETDSNRLPSYVFEPQEEKRPTAYQTYVLTDVTPDSKKSRQSLDNSGGNPEPKAAETDRKQEDNKSHSSSGSKKSGGDASTSFQAERPNSPQDSPGEATPAPTIPNYQEEQTEDSEGQRKTTAASEWTQESEQSTRIGSGDIGELEGLQLIAVQESISDRKSESRVSPLSPTGSINQQLPPPSTAISSDSRSQSEQPSNSVISRISKVSNTSHVASWPVASEPSSQVSEKSHAPGKSKISESSGSSRAATSQSSSNFNESHNDDETPSGEVDGSGGLEASDEPVASEENSQPSIIMTDKGAIRFQLPGRITHKTTIKVAHYPESNNETVVLNVPTPADAPCPRQDGCESEDPCGGSQQVPQCDPYGFFNNQSYPMSQQQAQLYSQQLQQYAQQQAMSGYGYNPYGYNNPYGSSTYPYGYGYPQNPQG